MFKHSITYCLLCLGAIVQAQISFKAVVDKAEVKVGERFQLSYIITSQGDTKFRSISLPNFKNFQVLGKNSGSNIRYSNNGLSRQYIESVVLLAQKPGTYTVSPAKVQWDGKEHLSNTIQITVIKADDKVNSFDKGNAPVKMRMILSKNEVFPNQNFIADIKLYAKSYDLLRRRSDIEVPGISGFQVTKISENEERNFQQESINGEVYVSEEIAQFQFSPTQTGNLEIPPFKIRLAIPLDFFEEKIVLLKTEPHLIHVKEFPPNAPPSFQGAVGNFKLNAILDTNDLKVNKPIDYELELIGEGNFSGINLPNITLSDALELYPPKRRNAFKDYLHGEKGKIVDEFVIVPQYGGNYHIPAASFTFFNPDNESYETVETQSFDIQVAGIKKEPKEQKTVLDTVKLASDSMEVELKEEEVKNLNDKTKKYIQLPEIPEFDKESSIHFSWYWLLTIPLIGFVLYLIFKRKKISPEQIVYQKEKAEFKNQVRQDISMQLSQLEIAKQNENLNDFTSVAQMLLNSIVSLFSEDTSQKRYTQSESSEILSREASDRFLAEWETLHQKNQLMRYAGSLSGESLETLYNAYEELVKDSLNIG